MNAARNVCGKTIKGVGAYTFALKMFLTLPEYQGVPVQEQIESAPKKDNIWTKFVRSKKQQTDQQLPCLQKPVKFTKISMTKTPFEKFQIMANEEAESWKKGANDQTDAGKAMIAKIDAAKATVDQVMEILVDLEKGGLKVWDSLIDGEGGEHLNKLHQQLTEKMKDGNIKGAAKDILLDFLSEISTKILQRTMNPNGVKKNAPAVETGEKSLARRMDYGSNVGQYLYDNQYGQYEPLGHELVGGHMHNEVYHGTEHSHLDAQVLQMVLLSVLFVVFCVCGILFVCAGFGFGIFAGRKAAEMNKKEYGYEDVDADPVRL